MNKLIGPAGNTRYIQEECRKHAKRQINESINQPINQSFNQSMNQLINQSIKFPYLVWNTSYFAEVILTSSGTH